MVRKKRDYSKNGEGAFHATKEQKLRRAERNRARAKAMKAGIVKKGDGKEVHHTKAKRKGKLTGPTRVISKKANRKMQPKRGGTKS